MNPTITSAKNPLVKQLRKLMTSAKARREAAMYIAEGAHLVESYLVSGATPLRYVCAESALDNQEIVRLATQLDDLAVEQVIITDDLFESLASIHAPTGILIIFTPHATPVQPAHTTVLLEDVQDPGNMGTILRTAAAAGVTNILLSPGCTSPWSPKALRAGMGAQFGLHIQEDVDVAAAVTASSMPTLVTTLSTSSQNLYDLDLTQPVVWIFGSEGQGVSQQLIDQATTHVRIPQADTAVESLNVAAAASVCLYEQYRQLSRP